MMNDAITIERAYELAGIATLAVLGVAVAVVGVIICAPFMLLGLVGYRVGLVR